MARLSKFLSPQRDQLKSDNGVAMMSVLLFMILLAGMSLVLLTVILGQIGPSYLAQKGTKTVYAAQAGLQSALSVIRSAAAAPNALGVVYGNPRILPCTVNGNLDGSTEAVKYAVTVRYFTEDPTGKPESWLASKEMGCSASIGVTTRGTTTNAAPSYALITSKGQASATPGAAAADGNRTVAAIYKFRVTNVNVPGGRIFDPLNLECLQAEPLVGGAIGVGSLVYYRAKAQCVDDSGPLDAAQLWIYGTTYQIKLASSTDGVTPGLCISGIPSTTGTPNKAKLETCRTGSDRYNQLWSWTGEHTWQGQQASISNGYASSWLGRSTETGTKYLQVTAGHSTTFAPDPKVGAGAASSATNQIVNYKEFGRCLDVTGTRIDDPFMITYPCKQDPSGTGTPVGTGKLAWNHKWYYTEVTTTPLVQQIYVYDQGTVPSGKRCLQTTGTTGVRQYPTFKSCSGSTLQDWKRVYKSGDYSTSYLILDSANRCLTANENPTDLYTTDGSGNAWSKVTVAACTGQDNQKWNAPPVYNESTFSGYKEIG
jgi:hypothetical protein